MAEPLEQQPFFQTSDGQPLIGIPFEENGHLIVRYFADEEAADEALGKRSRRDVRHLAGAWKAIDPDIEWDQVADELDRIRHESMPTPPIDLDL